MMLGSAPAGSPASCFITNRRTEHVRERLQGHRAGRHQQRFLGEGRRQCGRTGRKGLLRDLRVAEVVKLDMQLDAKGKVEAFRAKLSVSFKFEGT